MVVRHRGGGRTRLGRRLGAGSTLRSRGWLSAAVAARPGWWGDTGRTHGRAARCRSGQRVARSRAAPMALDRHQRCRLGARDGDHLPWRDRTGRGLARTDGGNPGCRDGFGRRSRPRHRQRLLDASPRWPAVAQPSRPVVAAFARSPSPGRSPGRAASSRRGDRAVHRVPRAIRDHRRPHRDLSGSPRVQALVAQPFPLSARRHPAARNVAVRRWGVAPDWRHRIYDTALASYRARWPRVRVPDDSPLVDIRLRLDTHAPVDSRHGLPQFRALSAYGERDIDWNVRENRKKARLAKLQ